MNKLLLLLFTMVLGILFVIIPETEPKDYFLFSTMKITLSVHVYFICEKVIAIILAYIICAEDSKYRTPLLIFFCIMILDLCDYILSYNSIWFRLAGLPVSMNIVKCTIFGLIVAKEWILTLRY